MNDKKLSDLTLKLDKYYDRMQGLVIKVAGLNNADDIFQEAVMKILKHLPAYDPARSPFNVFVYRMTQYANGDYFRSKEKMLLPREQDEELIIEGLVYKGEGVNWEISPEVLSAIDQLPKSMRELIVFRYVYGYKVGDIAKRIGKSLGNTSIKIKSALNMLSLLLADV
jgi:RNA polymerase sigma factor (sigma-70 family)